METVPPPELEIEPSRNPFGWVTLAVLIFLMFYVSLIAYLKKADPAVEAKRFKYSSQEAALKSVLTTNRILAVLGQAKKRPEDFRRIVDELKPEAAINLSAAEVLLPAQLLAGDKADPILLSKLAASAQPTLQTLAKIYGADVINRSEVAALEESLPKKGFRFAVIRSQIGQKASPGGEFVNPVPLQAAYRYGAALLFVLFAFLLGVLILVLYSVGRSNGQFEPHGHPAEPMTELAADYFAIRAAYLFVAFILVSITFELVVDKGQPMDWRLQSLSALVTIAACFATFRIPLPIRVDLRGIGFRKDGLGLNIALGLAGACANIPLALIALVVGQALGKGLPVAEHPVSRMIQDGVSAPMAFALFLAACVQAPLVEETLFRGTLLPALSTVLKSRAWGIVFSSFLFAVIHPTGIPAWPGLMMIGMTSAWLMYQSRSIVPSITMHLVHNGATLALALLLA